MFASSLYLSFANFTDTISLEIDQLLSKSSFE
mgnify:CR=1 FL=1